MQYRKKPVVIEAMKLPGGGMNEGIEEQVEIVAWLFANGMRPGEDFAIDEAGFHLETLEGTMRASWGDWIIKGVESEFYPCNNRIFHATYELVEENE